MYLLKTNRGYLPISESEKKKHSYQVGDDVKNYEYFVRGTGWRNFSGTISDEIEDHENLSWKKVCIYHDKFGEYVALAFAEKKVTPLVASVFLRGYYTMWRYIKRGKFDMVDLSEEFFECLAFDYRTMCFGIFVFDIVSTDDLFGRRIPSYLPRKTMYKGTRNISMKEFVKNYFGETEVKIIEYLLKYDNNN